MEQNTLTVKYLTILVKWRKLILYNFLILCLITTIFSLIVDSKYTATGIIIPGKESSSASFIPAGLSSFLTGSILGGSRYSGEELISILESRSIKESIVNQLSLIEKFEVENIYEAIRKLKKMTAITGIEAGPITTRRVIAIEINVTYKDPELAATITNKYISEVQDIVVKLKTQKAKEEKEFLSDQMNNAKLELDHIEQKLNDFQQINSAIAPELQIQKTVEAIAQLEAEKIFENIKLNILKRFHEKDFSLVKESEFRLMEIEHQMESLRKKDQESNNKSIFIEIENAPKLGQEYANLMRDFKIQETLFGYLVQEMEQREIQEKQDTPIIEVVDDAVAPDKRSFPKRKLMVITAGGLSLFFSFIFIIIGEYLSNMRTQYPESYQEMKHQIALLKNMFLFFRRT